MKNKQKENIIRKTFLYRAYLNISSHKKARRLMLAYADIWNKAIRQRQESYEASKKDSNIKPVNSNYAQYSLIRKSDHPEYKNYYIKSMECILAKLDGSYKSFFKLVKKDPKARPPGEMGFYPRVTYRCSGWKPRIPNTNRVWLSGIGWIRFKRHRPIEGIVKTVELTRKNGKYYIGFSCEIEKTGVCSPVSKPKSLVDEGLRQEYTSTGGSGPDLGGTCNNSSNGLPSSTGGSGPDLGGTCNLESNRNDTDNGGSGPDLGGTCNSIAETLTLPDGGSGPDREEIAIGFGWRQNMFLIDSDGRAIEHPEFYTNQLGRLAYLNQKLARRTRWKCRDCGEINEKYRTAKRKKTCLSCDSENIEPYRSKNWYKAKHTLAKFHEHLAEKRSYFLWNLARYYVDRYDKIVVNKWPMKQAIEYAVEHKTARKLCDGAYSKFIHMLKHKCNEFGKEFEERKDLLWQKEVDRLMDVAETESLRRMIRLTRTAILWPSQGHLTSLEKESRRRAI